MSRHVRRAVLAGLALLAGAGTAAADDTRVALVPGGPHPYFSAWEQAGKDACRDFKLAAADYKVPQKWELSTAEPAAREPGDPGLQRLPGLPGRPGRHASAPWPSWPTTARR